MSNHSDPKNAQALIAAIPRESPEELLSYAKSVFPDWILGESSQFSVELFKFNEQWAFGCAKMRTQPQRVLIVKQAYLDFHNTTHTLIRELCIALTNCGFVVIDSINFDICRECKDVIVSEFRVNSHNSEKGTSVVWNGLCQDCTKNNVAK